MKNIFSFLLFLLCAAGANAQALVNRAGPANTVQDARLAAQRNFIIPRFDNLTAANADLGLDYEGALIYIRSTNTVYYRQLLPKAWVPFTTSANSNCGLFSGGHVTWAGTGLTYDVTSAIYCINGTVYSFAGDDVTLATADATNDRFDVFALDNTGSLISITGTPSVNPQIPSHNPATQLYLTAVKVSAGNTTGGTQNVLWSQNTGEPWAGSANVNLTANFTSSTQQYHSTTSAEATAVNDQGALQFSGTTVSTDGANALRFFVRLKAATSGNLLLYIDAHAPITLGAAHGFNASVANQWQNITIPFSGLPFDLTTIQGIRIAYSGASYTGFFVDYITLQGGNGTGPGSSSGNFVSNVFRRSGTDSVYKTINGVDYFAFRDSTGGGTGFIPLAGTNVGEPVIGPIQFAQVGMYNGDFGGDYQQIDWNDDNRFVLRNFTSLGGEVFVDINPSGIVQIDAPSASYGLNGLKDFTTNIPADGSEDLIFPQEKYVIPRRGTGAGKAIFGNLEFLSGSDLLIFQTAPAVCIKGLQLDNSVMRLGYANDGDLLKNGYGFELGTTGLIVYDYMFTKGIQGKVDFTANTNDLSYVQKKYVGWRSTATLAAGTVTVLTDKIKPGYHIYVSVDTPGGTQGFLSAPQASIVDEVSFVINSSSSADTSTVYWWIAP